MSKIAVIGLGYWGVNVLRNFYSLEEIEEVLVYDLDQDRLKKVKNDFPKIQAVDSVDQIFNSDALAVIIATHPLSTHYQLGKKVLESHKHLWLEKPVASSVAEVSELVDISIRNNVLFHADHTYIYSSAIREVKNILDQGILGEIKLVLMTRQNALPNKTKEDVFWDLAYHDLYILFYWFGAVFTLKNFDGKPIFDSGFRDWGRIVLLAQSDFEAHITASLIGMEKTRKIVIYGQKNILVYNDLDQETPIKILDTTFKVVSTPTLEANKEEPLLIQAKIFLSSIARNINSPTDGKNSLPVIEVLESLGR